MSSSVSPVFADRIAGPVRTAGYAILTMAVLFPLLDLGAALWPTHFESATWRFGASGLISNYVMGASIELFLIVLMALYSNQRRVLLLLGAICTFIAVMLLGGSVLFVLDALQTRAKVTPVALHRFELASAGAFAKMVLFSLANGMLARGAFRGASSDRGRARARSTVAPIVTRPTETR